VEFDHDAFCGYPLAGHAFERAKKAMSDDEETDDPTHADRRNFYKVEQWSRDEQRVTELLFAGSSLDKAKRVFERITKHRPRIRLTMRQRTRVVQQHPPQ
jgi:hypothetical protein